MTVRGRRYDASHDRVRWWPDLDWPAADMDVAREVRVLRRELVGDGLSKKDVRFGLSWGGVAVRGAGGRRLSLRDVARGGVVDIGGVGWAKVVGRAQGGVGW